MSKNKNKLGVVYSTDPDYVYQYENDVPETETLPAKQQKLHVALESHHRGGKQVTLITGFIGTDDDLVLLCKALKTKCGVGGSTKDGEIIIQGDQREKTMQYLKDQGYTVR